MPRRPLTPCLEPGCPALVPRGRCPEHAREHARRYDRFERPKRDMLYQTPAWRAFRASILRDRPDCEACGQPLGKGATVSHIVPVADDPRRALDPTNVEAVHRSCHSRLGATRREIGVQARRGSR